jgi:hypothetical protein
MLNNNPVTSGVVGVYNFLTSLNPKSLAVGLIIGWLIIPSPMALLFPKPIQQALKNVSCGVNQVYQRLEI